MTSIGSKIVTSTITSFIPQSTLVATFGTKSYYSTFLTVSYITTEIPSLTTAVQVICPSTKVTVPDVFESPSPSPITTPVVGIPCLPATTIYSTLVVTLTPACPSTVPLSHPDLPASLSEGLPHSGDLLISPIMTDCHTFTSIRSDGSTSTIVVTDGLAISPSATPSSLSVIAPPITTTSSVNDSSSPPYPTGSTTTFASSGTAPHPGGTGTGTMPIGTASVIYPRYIQRRIKTPPKPTKETSWLFWL